MKRVSSIVVIGGGTGTFAVLNSLRDRNVSLTALMTMVDDGGSNRVLRDEFGLLPTSGIRQAMVALSENQTLMRDLFMYRFHKGNGISGMTFGNLFLAAMADILGSQEKAIEETAKLLDVKGNILPVSYDDVRLVATYADGCRVVGEHCIDEPENDGKVRITKLETEPVAKISDKAKKAILEADIIILGPGDFYTNTVANLVIKGVPEAILKSKAKLVFVTNLMSKYGEAYNYKASDYLKDLDKYLPIERLNYALVNSDMDYPAEALKKYRKEQAIPVEDDLKNMDLPKKLTVVRKSLLSHEIVTAQKGDVIHRSMIRHNNRKLGKALAFIINI